MHSSLKTEPTEHLFSYGTLQQEEVQLAAFGRTLEGTKDSLIGYKLVMVQVADQNFIAKSGASQHRNLQYTGDTSHTIEGTVFSVTKTDLEQADAYEPFDYKRVQVKLASGVDAWIYVYSNQ
jgi:gamma-glutamylcyclotransferase (GGCT)/AIG2-like uncharacterized protein YtfP